MAATHVSISFPPALSLPKLDGSNWATWSSSFDALMRLNGLCCHITHNTPLGAAPAAADVQAAWDAEEEALIGLLMLNLVTEAWKQVSNPTTYPSVFDRYTCLDTLFGSMGAMATFNLWRTLVNTKLQEGSPFQPQFQIILDTRNTLSENRMSVNDMQLAFIILDALPPSFSAIAGTILAVGNPNTLDPRMLIERILNEESRLSGLVSLNRFTPVKPCQKPRQQNAAALSSSAPAPQGGITCFYCQKPDNKANKCKKKQKDLESAKKGKAGQRKPGQAAAGQGACANVVATTIGGSSASIQEVHDVPQISLYVHTEKFVYISRDDYHNYCETIMDNFDYQPDTDNITNNYDKLYDGYDYSLCAVRKQDNIAPTKNGWLVDSGALHHFTPDITDFDTLEDDDTEVSLGDGSLVNVTQKGSVKLRVEGIDLTLTNVKYMPKCEFRILSPGSLIEKGAQVNFYNGGIDIFLNNRCIAQGQRIRSLYWVFMQLHLNLSMDTRVQAASANLETWHQRMGHLSYETVKAIDNAEPLYVYGLKLHGLQKDDTPCHGCQLGKSHCLPFPTSSKHAEVPLKIVHSDLVGPFQTNSIQGNKYFATFIDDCSKIVVITYMKSKDQFKQAFINYKAWAENQLSHTIKCLHSDCGSEYVNNDLKHILQEAGIEHKLTVPHSPQQKGRAECFNCTIMEKASAMLHDAGMSQGFWETAVATACHLYNRTPTRSNKWRTPLELWNGTIPDVSYFRVYGCKAYYHVPDHNRHKLDPKAREAVFVGYEPHSKGYIIRCGTAVAGLSSLHKMLHLTKNLPIPTCFGQAGTIYSKFITFHSKLK
jgi:transposase InsO family protein